MGKPKAKGNFEWFPGPAPSCVKVKNHHGKYEESKCEARAEKHGKPNGSYERARGPGFTSSGAEAVLEIPALHVTVKCAATSDVGEVTGPKTDVDRITFTGCESSVQKCTSLEGAKEGEIVTSPLESTLITHGGEGFGGKEPAAGEAWTQYADRAGAHAPYLAVFGCGSVGFLRVKGWLSGVTTGNINAMSSMTQTVFGAGVGEQDLETELSPSVTFETVVGPDASVLTATAHNTSASETEIRT